MNTKGYRKTREGFSLLEIMVTITIIGMLATLAVPAIREATRNAKVMRTGSDLRHYTNALATYNLANGEYPEDSYPGEMPPGMGEMMPYQFGETTPIGGRWDWDYGVFGTSAAVSIYNDGAGIDAIYAWLRLDRLMDDGSLATGKLRSRPSGIMFVMDEQES